MKRMILQALLVILVLAGAGRQGLATTPEAQRAFEKWQAAWNALKTDPRYPEEWGQELEGLHTSGAFEQYSDSIFAISAEAIKPGKTHLLRGLASGYLFKIGTDSALDILREYLKEPGFGPGLAFMMSESRRPEDVEAVIPLLRANHSMYYLSSDYDSLVYPWLLEELNDPNPARRFGASMHLARRFGDSTYFLPCARELVRAYDKHVAIKETAIDALVRQDPVPAADVHLLASAVSLDSSASQSWFALAAVVAIANRGDPEAMAALEAIRDTCHLMDYRERAARIVREIRKARGK
jgi:hypothetical protein